MLSPNHHRWNFCHVTSLASLGAFEVSANMSSSSSFSASERNRGSIAIFLALLAFPLDAFLTTGMSLRFFLSALPPKESKTSSPAATTVGIWSCPLMRMGPTDPVPESSSLVPSALPTCLCNHWHKSEEGSLARNCGLDLPRLFMINGCGTNMQQEHESCNKHANIQDNHASNIKHQVHNGVSMRIAVNAA